jgi:subtilisin family serine protease
MKYPEEVELKRLLMAVVLVSIIALLVTGFPTMPVAAGDSTPPASNTASISKISSFLSLHIKLKQDQAAISSQSLMKPLGVDTRTTGETTLVNQERIYLHFDREPTSAQINELNSMGVMVYPDTWMPPVDGHNTGFILAEAPIDLFDSLASIDYVTAIDTAEQALSPQNDAARTAMNVDPVWTGGYTGTGVTIAVIDSGLDTSNPDIPVPLAAIDYSNYPTTDATIANTVTGHGTHVTSSLLGRGVNNSAYTGVAPGANLVFIKVGNDTDGSASSSALTYAIRDAVDVYHAKIINISMGGWSEFHDGTDPSSQAVDYATGKGATVFAAAGNYGSRGWHYSVTVAANSTTPDIPVMVASDASSKLAMSLTWRSGSYINLKYLDSNHAALQSSGFGSSSQTKSSLNNVLTNAVGPGTYYLQAQNNSSTSQFLHIYYMGGSTAVTFSNPDPNYTITSPADANGAIAVGAYVTRNSWTNYQGASYNINPSENVGAIAGFSGRGPRVDGGAPEKPNIVAPGCAIISSRDPVYTPGNSQYDPYIIDNDGQNLNGTGPADYYVMQGTSMASAMAAGVGALILSKNPDFTPAQVRHALEVTAVDKGSGDFDNNYGWGLINAASAIDSGVTLESYSDAAHTAICHDFNDGTKYTAYFYGTGYLKNHNYYIIYYDGLGQTLAPSINPVSSSAAGILSWQHAFDNMGYPGTWNVLVCDVSPPYTNYSFVQPCSVVTVTFSVTREAIYKPNIYTLTASGVSTNSAILNASLLGAYVNISVNVYFEWGINAGYGHTTSIQTGSVTGITSAQITDLTPGATYHYRAVAVASTGRSTAGSDMSVKTWVTAPAGRAVYSNINVYIMNIDSTNVTCLTSVVDNGNASLSKDGAKIVFTSTRDSCHSNIYKMNADGTDQVRLTNNNSSNIIYNNPQWSPDGKKIIFDTYDCANNQNHSDIFVIDADGSNQRQLTTDPGGDEEPCWSPDGTRISFASSRGGDFYNIYLMNSDGTNPTRLTNSNWNREPAWSPDGSQIAFISCVNDIPQVFLINSNGSNLTQLTQFCSSSSPFWSPDGSKIAFLGFRSLTEGGGLRLDEGTFIISADGNNLVKLNTGSISSWSVGDWIAPAVSTVPASDFTSNSVTLNGSLTDKGSAGSVSVSFDWGTDTSYSGGNVPGVPSSLSAPGAFSAMLPGLTRGQTYHYRAKAMGNGTTFGDDASFIFDIKKKLVFTSGPQIISAGSTSGYITIQSQDYSGNPTYVMVPTQINLTSASGGGRFDTSATGPFNGNITSATISWGCTTATFYYRDTLSGNPLITAAGQGFDSGSQNITVQTGAPSKLVFSTQVSAYNAAGMPFVIQPVVGIQDSFGNTVTNSLVPVTLGITSGSGISGAVLSGNNTVNAVNGTAHFTGLSIDKPGGGYLLTASSGNLTSAVSNSFAIITSNFAKVNIVLNLQGSSRPEAGWIVPVNIKFFTPGTADEINGTPLYSFSQNTTRSGNNAVTQVTGINLGTYDVLINSTGALCNIKKEVVITASLTDINMGTLLTGNANGDHVVNIQDFGILAGTYKKLSGADGFDTRADFDCNGAINITDFGLLAANYGKRCPLEVP